MKNGHKSSGKYGKSPEQLAKERERRRKMREYVLHHPEPWSLTQSELAKALGCSQATVSRDLAKLGSSRWNPFRLLIVKWEHEWKEKEEKRRLELKQGMANMSLKERFKLLTKLLLKERGGHWYPENSKPRGKSFTSVYQPRWSRWGSWTFRCENCGCNGEVKISGDWQRGQTVNFECPNCGRNVGVTRPELPVEKRVFTAPCGCKIVISTKGRWDRNRVLLFDCPKCGEEHHVEKHLTQSIK